MADIEKIKKIEKFKKIEKIENNKRKKFNSFNNKTYISKLNQFISHYEKQGVFKFDSINTKEKFLNTIQTALPLSFWISNKAGDRHRMAENFEKLNEKHGNLFKKIEWLTNTDSVITSYKSEMPRDAILKNEKYKEISGWIKTECNVGNVVRQEEVSMIPPVVLDVAPGMAVLDMCAAPGSKTCQIAEMLRRNSETALDAEGIIVAVDAGFRRSHLLARRLKQMEASNILVLNAESHIISNFVDNEKKVLKFDRVLCDVPCSGDGTVRKNPSHIIRHWSEQKGKGLSKIQFLIAKRGFELLKPGGILVYSTCSFNPVENEDVVLKLLLEFKDSIELVDITQDLKEIKSSKGLSSWKEKEEDTKNNFRPPLERCVRFLPTDLNSGGFFIAKIRKVKNSENKVGVKVVKNTDIENRKRKKPEEIGFKKVSKKLREEISDFFGIKDDKFLHSLHFKLSLDQKENGEMSLPEKIHFLPPSVAKLAVDNIPRFRLIMAGVVVFKKFKIKDVGIDYRILHSSIETVSRYIHKQRLEVSVSVLLKLLETRDNRLSFDEFCDKTVSEALSRAKKGSFVLETKVYNGRKFYVATRIGGNAVYHMVEKSGVERLKNSLKLLIK